MLTRAVETYLAVRRAAGFALRSQGSQLKSFAAFSKARKQHYVSTDIAIEWAGLAPSVSERARRLGTIIRFARYLRAEDGGTASDFRCGEVNTTDPVHSDGRTDPTTRRGSLAVGI